MRTGAHMADRLVRLAASTAGNVLAITAAALPFILLLVGGGIDVSRGYMTRSSLQSACDAGVLAGRRAMSRSGTYGTAERAKAQKMFDFNLQAEVAGNTGTTFTTASHPDGSVTGQASTNLPLSVMQVIGAADFALSVTCSAELQMASADVMFVLDTTGSMAWCPDGTECYSGPNSRIVGMREAVRDFYRTVAGAVVDKDTTRIRFGFVPYTMTVNATELLSSGALPASYIASSANYQTKLAYYNTPVYVGTDSAQVPSTETYGSNITQANCNSYGVNAYPTSGSNPTSSGTAPANKVTTTYSYKSWTKVSGSGSSALGTCVRNKSVVTTSYVTQYRFTNYRYTTAAVPTVNFRARGPVNVVTAISSSSLSPTQGYFDMATLAGMTGVTGLSTSSSTWSGCLEERATVQDLDMDPVPSGALDLDINSAPSNAASSWKPYWPAMVYDRGTGYPISRDTTGALASTWDYCPAGRMKTFSELDISDPSTVPSWLETYLLTLTANGGTYHDIGMIWGANGQPERDHGQQRQCRKFAQHQPPHHLPDRRGNGAGNQLLFVLRAGMVRQPRGPRQHQPDRPDPLAQQPLHRRLQRGQGRRLHGVGDRFRHRADRSDARLRLWRAGLCVGQHYRIAQHLPLHRR
ncbi:MAG: TadE/TadG family type IV pilus assembly protein [Croceibacterium sp.]